MWRDHPFSQKNKAAKRAVRRGERGRLERNPLPIMAFIHIYISLLLENIFVGWWY